MQPTENPKPDRTPEVEPPIRHTVPWRVISVEIIAEGRLRVTFVDGTEGEVEMGAFLRHPKTSGTVFESLRDPTVFAQARVERGAITWPNGAGLAPDAMYDPIHEHGVWVVD